MQLEQINLGVSCITLIIVGLLYYQTHIKKRVGRKPSGVVVLDTSTLIDGRVVSVVQSGFLSGRLLIPEAVLDELQLLADGKDAYKRERARSGLEVASQLRSRDRIVVEVTPYGTERAADAAVLESAVRHRAAVMSTDYALLARAEATGLRSMNINELATLLKDELSVGDVVTLAIEKVGDSKSQGVGHASDGTLFIVEGAAHRVGQAVQVRVKKLSQTKTGRMVFAHLVDR